MKPARIFLGNADGLAARFPALGAAPGRPTAGSAFHGQECSSVWLLLQGTAWLELGGAQVMLPRRRLCVVRDARVSLHLEGPVSMLALAFSSAQLDERLRGRAGHAASRRRMLYPECGLPAAGLVRTLRRPLAGAGELDLDCRLDQFLLGIAADQQHRHARWLSRTPGRTQFDRSRTLRRLLLARSVLQMEGGERVPVARLAEMACYSPSQFVRTFSSVFETTPGELRQQFRLSRAKSLLATTRLSVDEVALEVGYENRSAFSRMFRAGTGMSASQYRGLGGAVLQAGLA
ncbi:helix-turn-helix transcriptional regulator [Pseudomarimonas salicorniae]|uniref:Helix-turn-helix transcriptional regulator n=1 Tax=Pseudomarimonas salicorniae TaxID=2933270 RepID=A0ABT0GM09_9GAMM|nr:helix-turn-helix transcriptional regulator [Lysobacter sp. CAU 1642]MCK7595582.1 helix-turn-helix transcriptional regulator [Lysobacter sp. CAU 1642]